ncbi:TetR/AcrR family transcriptional regulator [Microbacterium hominis]|uniref:TetR/AcrR family transcriptional regulator n=1 Tax=Microbacterium hominis TaxID=162426 RepID=A0A7D4UHM3_9MICO|nr:TetR/AcrR family transcriptional regulator [Microbacterium hominis]
MPTASRRRGRPRGGDSGARERIVDAAIAEFGERGYDAATIRGIAGRAGVDAALVHHYFGTKADLFAGAIGAPLPPTRGLDAVLAGDLDSAGERVARFVLEMWEDPVMRKRGVAVLRAMIGNRRTAALLVGFVSREILARIADRLEDDPHARRRAGLAASQIVGMLVTRYVLELPPMADPSVDELVAAVGPTLQRYLTGDLGAAQG